ARDPGAAGNSPVPASLVRAMRTGDCILVVGADLDVADGFPAWPEVVAQLIPDLELRDQRQWRRLAPAIAERPELLQRLTVGSIPPTELQHMVAATVKSLRVGASEEETVWLQYLDVLEFVAAIDLGQTSFLSRNMGARWGEPIGPDEYHDALSALRGGP